MPESVGAAAFPMIAGAQGPAVAIAWFGSVGQPAADV
jgi:hypothetical protein